MENPGPSKRTLTSRTKKDDHEDCERKINLLKAQIVEVREDLEKEIEESKQKDIEIIQLKDELEAARKAIRTPSQSQASQASQYCPEDIFDKSLTGIFNRFIHELVLTAFYYLKSNR